LAGEHAKYAALTPKQLAKRLQQMEQAMYRHAQNLEFEEAAAMRNEIEHVRSVALGPESA
jgi:excinuclease ABC subunit B